MSDAVDADAVDAAADADAARVGEIELPTAADTRRLGERIADVLRPGDVVVLSGPLGAGKTALTQGIGAGLGVGGQIASPTFVIARVHEDGRVPLVHVDAYRLTSLAEVDDLDLDVSVEESVTVVEWGVGLAEQLGEAHLSVSLRRALDDERRWARIEARGGDWAQRIGALA